MNFSQFVSRYQRVPVEEYSNRVLEAVPEPVVSVQVLTYQHANFIRDCLDGILMQETDFPFEILIGEDESSDGTREICKKYADRHPDTIRLFLHRRENNIAIHGRPTPKFQGTYTRFKCRGTYIALCEGDDYWTDPLKLQKQVDFLEANEEYVVSCHQTKKVDSSGKQLSAEILPGAPIERSQEALMRGPVLSVPTMCFRNVLERYPESYFEVLSSDIFLSSMLGRFGKSRFQSSIEPSVYRIHDGGIWSSKDYSKRLYCRYHSRKKLAEYWKSMGVEHISETFREESEKAREDYVFAKIDERKFLRFVIEFAKLQLEYIRGREHGRFVGANERAIKRMMKRVQK